MKIEQIIVGQKVKSLRDFMDIPKGTIGVIDELYNLGPIGSGGFMVAWDLPDKPLPKNYIKWDGKPAICHKYIRDGFDIETELQFLEII